MTIKNKLILGPMLLVIVTGSLSSSLLSWLSIDSAGQILQQQAVSKLLAVREMNKTQIERYFQRIDRQMLTFADDHMIINAMHQFKRQVNSLTVAYTPEQLANMRQALLQFYRTNFAREYAKKNRDGSIDVQALAAKLDDTAVVMQYQYISANSYPLGQKHRLDSAVDGSEYSRIHQHYHPPIRNFQSSFDYYDIFLVDPDSGRVVYSVFKELDYATSLLHGAYANSGLGRAFQRANQLNKAISILEDFSPYAPSYQAPEAFSATPIFDQGKKIGILIFQLPIDAINNIMTNGQQWQKAGLGLSGESYLIGSDYKARSLSRFLIEDKNTYLTELKDAGTDMAVLENIKLKNTNIGLQTVNTPGAQSAINGKSGVGFFADYRGVPVISAYTPLNINGLTWAMLTEIDQQEAFAPVATMKSEVIQTTLLVLFALAIISWIAGRYFAAMIISPIQRFATAINCIVKTDSIDLSFRLADTGRDEFAQLAVLLNRLLARNHEAIEQIIAAGSQLESSAKRLSDVSVQTRQLLEQQNQQTEQVATAMSEMSVTVQEVARNTSQTSAKADEGDRQAQAGSAVIGNTINNINRLSDNIEQAEQAVKRLEQDSDEIGSVLDVIRGIAEQTNLLALNAAIEAARAGEQGRGFAVVADEVRTLAGRTQDSTQQIQEMIERLQSGASSSAQVMEASCRMARETVERAHSGQAALEKITQVIANINDMTSQIATAAEQQSAVTEEITANIVTISSAAQQTLSSSEQVSQNSDEMNQLADRLQKTVRVFNV